MSMMVYLTVCEEVLTDPPGLVTDVVLVVQCLCKFSSGPGRRKINAGGSEVVGVGGGVDAELGYVDLAVGDDVFGLVETVVRLGGGRAVFGFAGSVDLGATDVIEGGLADHFLDIGDRRPCRPGLLLESML